MKILSKRIISSALTAVMLIGTLPVFAAEKNDEVYLYEDFNGYATNESNTKISAENITGYVKAVSENDKMFEVKAGIQKGYVSAKWTEQSDSIVMGFDIKQTDAKALIGFEVVNEKGNNTTLFETDSKGIIKTYDDKYIGGLSANKTESVAVVCDNINEEYSVYINGRCLISGWYLPASVNPKEMRIYVSGGDKFDVPVYFDKIRVYQGADANKKFKATAFNPAVIELVEPPARVGTAIITNNGFDLPEGDAPTSIGESTLYSKSNIAEIMASDGNSYLRIEKTTSNDFHLDTQFTNDLNYMVVQADFKFDKFGQTIYPFNVRDNVSNVSVADEIFATIDGNGALKLSNNKTAYTFTKGKWYNLAAAFNFINRTIDVYVDGKEVEKNLPFKTAGFYKPRLVRTWYYGTDNPIISLDNYRIYEAVSPVSDMSELEKSEKSIMSDYSRENTLLKGRTAMCISNGLIYKDGIKEYTEVPTEQNDDYFVSRQTAEKLIGTVDAAYGNSVPLKQAGAKNGKYVYENKDKYLLIFSDNKFTADDALIKNTAAFMKMQLPSAENIEKDFKANNAAHPRILASSDDWAKIKSNIEKYPEFKSWNEKIIAQADSKLATKTEYYHYEIQENILHPARRFKEKMLYWGYAWKITGDKKYVNAAVKEMKAVSEFKDWDPAHAIDTGELLFGSAIGYDWMYEALTDEQRKIIEEGTKKLGLDVIRSAYYGKLHTDQRFGILSGGNFVMSNTNFNVVVNGGVTAAALAYADVYPEECFDIISKAIQSLGYMLPQFEPSGGWEEGPNYWDYTTSYLANMVSALYSACGTDYGIMKHPGVSLTPYYAIYLDSYQGLNNFSDTSRGLSWNSAQFSLFGKVMNQPAFTKERYAELSGKNIGSTPSVFDMIWLDMDKVNDATELPLDNLTPGIDMVSMRESWDRSDAMNFGTHGGNNSAYHGHYDGGTWIFDILGERWAVDLGMDQASYVGHKMDKLYRTRAEGHNMLVFNPGKDAGFDNASYTNVLRYETAPKGGIVVYDNSGGYKQWTSNVTRGFYVGDERRSLTVRDEFTVKGNDTVVYWNMQTPADIQIDGNKAILTINGKKVQVEFSTNAKNFEILALKAEPFDKSAVDYDDMAKDPDMNKLALKATVSGSAYIEAKLSAVGEPASKSGMINKPISEWKLPEGELIKRGDSSLKNISVNGKAISDFKPNKTTYSVPVLEGQPMPEIQVESVNGKYEISKASSTDEVTAITSYDDSGLYSTVYVIKYVLLKTPKDVFGMTRNTVYDLQVSSTPEEANVGPNMLDGDLNTRWAGQGVGEWALFDLGSVKPIDAFAIAYEWGDERNYSFSVEVSEDGVHYTQVYSGASSGTTEDMELVPLAARVNARYVKFIGGGNTVNTWNGVREFAILTQKGE